MNKLSFNTLKSRVKEVASEELLNSINGGVENACHIIATVPSQGGDLIIYTK